VTRLNVLLLVLVVACALGVVTSQHRSRTLFVALEGEQGAARRLDVEWTQLQLEQGTWATSKRVEGVATRQLGMQPPSPGATVVLTLEAAP